MMIILSEDDIMNLSIADRAKVMSQDFYNKSFGGAETSY